MQGLNMILETEYDLDFAKENNNYRIALINFWQSSHDLAIERGRIEKI